ncbi:hypothetical protein F53441_8569 [Fusarium austroafricanum]|uniref:Uncharacterized protein n=1 Tax=Fusarium austroafricanum TaxID=2364996 RepID=A0A8H4NWF5_9HYPO|nr:hypothetical protein F53441_8569 [Fusarium austroafricanum]
MGDNPSRPGRFRPMSHLGKVQIAVLAFLFVVCLGCLTFLAFLWGADENNTVWRSIVLAGWMARSITITSLVLRWATAAQAAACTSMLAAILLQKGAVPLPAAAAVSIIKFNNTGPWSLLRNMKAKWHRGSISVGLLTALLTLTTLSLQFTSTVLLSQVGIASLPVATSIPQTHYGIETDGDTYYAMPSTAPSLLDITPARYPTFAEWTPNATHSHTASQHGVIPPSRSSSIVDTGTVLRAFLPINDDEKRSRVVEYHGFATVVDTRVVCMRPKLSNVVFDTGSGYRVTGLANIEQKPLGFVKQESDMGSKNFSLSFDCNFAASAGGNYSKPDWALALCRGRYQNSDQGIYSFMQSSHKKQLGNSYVIVNATLLDAMGDFDDSSLWEPITRSDSAQKMEVNATRTTPILPEPSLPWDASTATWNTNSVLQQLGGVTPEIPTTDRGVFDLAPRSWQWRKQPSDLDLTGDAMETTEGLHMVGSDPLYQGMMNSAQYSIFGDVAMSTNNPALALQAFFTRLCSICYYDRITMFDAVGPSLQVSLTQVTRPLGWTAFIIVAAVTVLHLVLVLSVILIFRRAGNLSRIQNAWASVSQLLGPVTEDWIRDADTVDDKTVKAWLEGRGLNKTLVGVEHVQGRVHLVEKEKIL